MGPTQSLEDFYRHKLNWMPDNLKNGMGHFNVFRLQDFVGKHARSVPYSRKDYFKITLLIGKNQLCYADKIIDIEGQALVFSNPFIPYKWEAGSDEQAGFFCIFTDTFFSQFGNIKEYPVFQPGGMPVFFLTDEQLPAVKN